jgi:hypothetical protein
MESRETPVVNPLAPLISDDVYALLVEHQLLSEKGIRDFTVRERYRELRDAGKSAGEALELLNAEHQYLQHDTLRKIIYARSRRKER